MIVGNNFISFTSLRGFAALWVVFFHIKIYLAPYCSPVVFSFISKGYLAVDFFFVLSGFIIALNYNELLVGNLKTKYISFLLKRIARVYPLHIFVLCAYLAIVIAYWITGRALPGEGRYALVTFVENILLINNWGWGENLTWNIPSWSISTEWAAYLVFPVFSLSLRKLKSIYYIVLIVFIDLSLLGHFCLRFGDGMLEGEIPNVGLLRCWSEFYLGVVLHRLTQLIDVSRRVAYTIFIFSIMLFCVILLDIMKPMYFIQISIFFLLFSLIFLKDSVVSLFLTQRLFIHIGEISYSIYMWHYWLKDVFKLLVPENYTPGLLWFGLYFSLLYLLSSISYSFVEVPARRFLRKIGMKYGL